MAHRPVPDDFLRSFIVMPGKPGIYWVPQFKHPFLVARPIDNLGASVIIHYPTVDFEVVPASIVSATIPDSLLNNLPDT
jgi:hypothetical protein